VCKIDEKFLTVCEKNEKKSDKLRGGGVIDSHCRFTQYSLTQSWTWIGFIHGLDWVELG